MRHRWLLVVLIGCGTWAGCGTTKWTDTKRTATEQMLISDAMDRAVSELDLRALAGKEVFLDDVALDSVTDHEYLTSSLRQHMLASGCILKAKAEEADYILEARAGAVGTDHHDVLYGVPAVNVPAVLPFSALPSTIPEIPFAKKTEQRAVAKIAMFAYNRTTGRPVWQSGVVPKESRAKDFWLFGAGPFQRGTIYEGTNFAGNKITIPLIDPDEERGDGSDVSVAEPAYFVEPEEKLARQKAAAAQQKALTPPEGKNPNSPEGSSPEVIVAGHAARPPAWSNETATANPPPTDAPPPKPPIVEMPSVYLPSADLDATAAPLPPSGNPFRNPPPPSFSTGQIFPYTFPATPYPPFPDRQGSLLPDTSP